MIWNLTDGWILSAWCELQQDFRTFRFDRMVNLTATGERFDENEATGLHAFMESEQCEARDR